VFYVGSIIGLWMVAAFVYGYARRLDRDVQLVFHEHWILHRVRSARRRVPHARMRAVRFEKTAADALLPVLTCEIVIDDGTTLVLSPHYSSSAGGAYP
jgi:hypothetical protein